MTTTSWRQNFPASFVNDAEIRLQRSRSALKRQQERRKSIHCKGLAIESNCDVVARQHSKVFRMASGVALLNGSERQWQTLVCNVMEQIWRDAEQRLQRWAA